MKLISTALLPVRRVLFASMLAIMGLSLLQGCFPVMVAGIGTTAFVAADRRTAGAIVDDETIERRTGDILRKNFGTLNRFNVTSYNRNVLLTGEVQNENVKAEAERLAGTIKNVRVVVNELVIAPPVGFAARSGDSVITANVKARFLPSSAFSANHVKVVTEGGTVFLMGIVTRDEAEQATEVARTSKNVKKVVRVFEYIDESEAKELDARENTLPPEAP
jgi:osmotically-inducible protein OsmY